MCLGVHYCNGAIMESLAKRSVRGGKKRSLFITFEGGEGTGKSVQSKILAEKLRSRGLPVLLTREPGGTPNTQEIRALLVQGKEKKWHPITESLLYLADRAEHWFNVVKPALDAGQIVISDRFQDSTLVYQGHGKGVSIDLLTHIYTHITGGIYPDRTYVLLIDPAIGLARSKARPGNADLRFENMALQFHTQLFEAFSGLAQSAPHYKAIDASATIEEVADAIYADFMTHFLS